MTTFEAYPEAMRKQAEHSAEVPEALDRLRTWWESERARIGDPFGADKASEEYRQKLDPQLTELDKGLADATLATRSYHEALTTHADNYTKTEGSLLDQLRVERPDVVA